MTAEHLLVAASITEEALAVYTPRPAQRHVIELRIMTHRKEQQALTHLFDRCHDYCVRCAHAANQLIEQFRATEAYQTIAAQFAKAQTHHARAVAQAAYKRLREQYRLNQEHPFCQQLVATMQQTSQGEEIPAHIAQRITYAIWQETSRRLANRKGKVRYPSYRDFRVIEAKKNGYNITFDPRPHEMKLRVEGQTYAVRPLRNSDFEARQPQLVQAYVTGGKGQCEPGHIHYCRIIRRLVNHRGQIEWGYWLQLVVQGPPPVRRNTPAVAVQTQVAGLCQEPTYQAAYKEGACLLYPTRANEPTLRIDQPQSEQTALQQLFTLQSYRAERKSRYHRQAKELLAGVTTLYATPMHTGETTGLTDCGHAAFWQSLRDIARHTHTQLIPLPIDQAKLETYQPQHPTKEKKRDTNAAARPKTNRKPQPYTYFRPWKVAYLLTCLCRQEEKGRSTRYTYWIDEPSVTRRLRRFRRSMLTAVQSPTLQALSPLLHTTEYSQWTDAIAPSHKNEDTMPSGDQKKSTEQEPVVTSHSGMDSKSLCQVDLPSSKPNNPPVPTLTEPQSAPKESTEVHPLVDSNLLEQGSLSPDVSEAYLQLSSWTVQLPALLIKGEYRLSIVALRLLYLFIALAQKKIFQLERPAHQKGQPYTMWVTPHFLSYSDRGKSKTSAILRSAQELMDAEKIRFKKRPVRIVEQIEVAPPPYPAYYIGIRKLYRVTLTAEFMEYLYTPNRYSVPLHVLVDCQQPYQARLISYALMKLRNQQKQIDPKKADKRLRPVTLSFKELANQLQIDQYLGSPLYGPQLYQHYLLPLFGVVEHYFYLGDINFALWCKPLPPVAIEAMPDHPRTVTLHLQLPPERLISQEEYDQLVTDAPYYRHMLRELIRLAFEKDFELYHPLSKTELWDLAEQHPEFYQRIWSCVSRMIWFMGKEKQSDKSVKESLRLQLYTELALLKQYTQKKQR